MLAPWRSLLSAALHRNRSEPHARYFQLATVTPAGYPANRTVVFRGFLDEQQNTLKIVTDLRNQKIQDLEHQEIAEICWYFTKTREQFRIRGKLQLVTAEETQPQLQLARQTTWKNLSDAARSQFTWLDPGKPIKEDNSFVASSPDPNTPLLNFGLLLLIPNQIDYLQLRGSPQQRCLYTLQKDQTWSIQPINP
ncbi:MAG: Npun_F5749 family FMN-dependent PPOX-type flavoprotein [Waterburya sp.]